MMMGLMKKIMIWITSKIFQAKVMERPIIKNALAKLTTVTQVGRQIQKTPSSNRSN